VPFDHIEIEDLLNPGSPVNVAPGVQKFAPATGNHNYVIRTIDSLGNSLAAVEVGVTSYTIVYLADIESITIPLLAPNQIIIAFDNFVSCSSATGFSIEGITDGLTFVNQPDGKSVKLQLSSKVFAAASVYTLSYTGAGSLKQADNTHVAAWSSAAVVNNSN
jgi:hypothetical protein